MEENTINSGYVAVPDKGMSKTAGPGQKNNIWRDLTTGLFCADIREPDLASLLAARWVRKLRRQIMRLEGRRYTPDAKRPAVRTVMW